jgi:ribosomal protein S18 acetylase RimI-like enzyme
VTVSLTIAPLTRSHRSQIQEIVVATGVFSRDEVQLALEVFDEGCGSGVAGHGSRPQPATGNLQPAVRSPQPDYEFIGAFNGDDLLGYACFGPTPSTAGTYDLYWIAVHPAAQRSGAGAALMIEVERQLNERGARLVVVETSSRDDYAPTRSFYHKRGYSEAARLRGFYAPGDDRVVLTKRISDGPVVIDRRSPSTPSYE